jgi:hypothetical protein
MTDLLRDAFVAHEHLAPDAETTLAAIHDRLRTRRRRAVTTTLSTAGAVAAVAAVAVAASLVGISRHSQGPRTPAPATHQSTPPPPASAPLSIGAGWLPPGKVTRRLGSVGDGVEGVGYTVTPPSGPAMTIQLWLEPNSVLPDKDSNGLPGQRTTIDGRPAREWNTLGNPDTYNVDFLPAGGRRASVSVGSVDPNHVVPPAVRRQVGQHVAASMAFTRHDQVAAPLALGYLPAGLVVRRIDIDEGLATLTLAPASGHLRDDNAYPTVTLQKNENYGPPTFTPGTDPDSHITTSAGRPVQGHRTWVEHANPGSTDPGMGTRLTVPDAKPGWALTITGGRTVTSLPELYRIADAIMLS